MEVTEQAEELVYWNLVLGDGTPKPNEPGLEGKARQLGPWGQGEKWDKPSLMHKNRIRLVTGSADPHTRISLFLFQLIHGGHWAGKLVDSPP